MDIRKRVLVKRKHCNRYIQEGSNLYMDFQNSKAVWFNDPEMENFQAEYNMRDDVMKLKRELIRGIDLYTESCMLAGGTEPIKELNDEWSFVYVIISLLGNYVKENDKINVKNSWKPEARGSSQPYLITQVNMEEYGYLLKIGNSSIVKIFTLPFPLITNTMFKMGKPLRDYGTYQGLSDGKPEDNPMYDKKWVSLDKITNNDNQFIPNIDVRESVSLNEAQWSIDLNKVKVEERWSPNREIKIWSDPHFKYILNVAGQERELYTKFLFGMDSLSTKTGKWSLVIDIQTLINGTTNTIIGRIQNGYYQLNGSMSVSSYVIEDIGSMPNTSSAYTNFLQNGKNSLNTSKWAINKQNVLNQGFGFMNNYMKPGIGALNGFMEGGPVGAIAGGIGGFISGVTGGIENAVRSHFQYEKGMKMLDAKMSDLENNSMGVSGNNGEDNMMVSNRVAQSIFFRGILGSYATYIYSMGLQDNQKVSVGGHYHQNGYILNIFQSFHYLNEFSEGRQIFNYWEIDGFKNLFMGNSISAEIVNWLNAKFSNGIRLWNYKDVDGNEIEFLDYSRENWEYWVAQEITKRN